MNSLSRYYLDCAYLLGEVVTLKGEEAHHAIKVKRIGLGKRVELFDGRGNAAIGQVVAVSKAELSLSIDQLPLAQKKGLEVHLVQAIAKSATMELVVQKAVELGVSSIQPIVSKNSITRPEQIDKKRDKWQRIAREACKQCGKNWLPEVRPVVSFLDWMQMRESPVLEIVAALDQRSNPIKKVLAGAIKGRPGRLSLVVGPEGDFSQGEYDRMHEVGMEFVSMGKIVLRVETATMFCLSAIQYEEGFY